MDIMLSGSSGMEVAAQLHAEGYGDVPMLAMSASNLMANFAVKSGLFEEVLLKPFDLEELLTATERLLHSVRPGGLSNGDDAEAG